MGDAPFQLEHRAEGRERQRPKTRPLLGKGLVDHALRGGVQPRIGDAIEPLLQLAIQVVEIAERASEEEVLADVPIQSLDLAFGFGPIGAASLRLEAVVDCAAFGKTVPVRKGGRDSACERQIRKIDQAITIPGLVDVVLSACPNGLRCGPASPLLDRRMGPAEAARIRRRHPSFKKPAKGQLDTTVLSNANPPDKNAYAFSPGNTIQTHSECRIAPRSLGECGIAARFLDCEWVPTPRPNQFRIPAPLLLDYGLLDRGRPSLLFDHGPPDGGRLAAVDGLDRLADRGL
jgi:hypothetical protein